MSRKWYIHELRYLAAHALWSPLIQWRHHGIGVLQGYLHEGDRETRFHIWDPSLVLPGFDETNGLVHDHRFSFKSYVLLGEIYNEEFFFTPHPNGEWVMNGVLNARKSMEESDTFNTPLGQIKDETFSAQRHGSWHSMGDVYSMKTRRFHMTKVNGLTVTMVVKTRVVSGPAVIASKKGVPIIHAFEHPHSGDYLNLIKKAADRLSGTPATAMACPPTES